MPRINARRSALRRTALLALLAATVCLPSLPNNPLAALEPAAFAAAPFTVNSTGDGADSNTADGVCNDGSGNCTLRAAIQQANANADADTVGFSVTGTITLTSALPDITSNMTIGGPGARLLTVSGNNTSRVFTIASSANVTISDLTLSNGRTSNSGGAINNIGGTLTLNNCSVSNNTATGSGGGLFSSGILTVNNSTISGNNAQAGGGLFSSSTAVLTNTTVSSNRAVTNGGGIESVGPLTLRSVTIYRNSAQSAGGGISNPGIGALTFGNTLISGNTAASSGPDCSGANLTSQDYNLLENTVGCSIFGTTTHNVTGVPARLTPLQDNGGPTLTHGPLPGSPVIDQGNSTLANDQRLLARPADVPGIADAAGGNGSDIGAVEIQAAEILLVNSLADTTDGSCDAQNCTLREALAAANSSPEYNAIYFTVAGTINLSAVLPDIATDMTLDGPGANVLTVRRNTTANFRIFNVTSGVRAGINGLTITNGEPASGTGGGGVMNSGTLTMNAVAIVANTATGGGGINNPGVLTLLNSTVSGNTAGAGGGGGVFNSSRANVVNSTISGNNGGFGGGGIFNFVGTTTVTNSTITNNSQRGIWNLNTQTVILSGSIIANNTDTSTEPDTNGPFISNGYNLIKTPGSASITEAQNPGTNITGQDPKLGPLADNGGPTRTHALLAGSPAIDRGRNFATDTGGNLLTRDQRGRPRPFDHPSIPPAVGGDNSDIGAFELTPISEAVADKETNEDTPLSFTFFVGDQTVTSLTATSNNQTLVPDANITISGTGPDRTVSITPAANQNGVADITINLTGSGEGSVARTFRLTVRAVNDAPSFTKGPDQTVAEDAGPQTVTNWATAISAGPNEPTQAVSFLVTGNTNPALFSAGPSVSPSGTLTYTPAPNANGSATITIVLKDDAGTANGGQDTSPAQTFVINVTPVNDAPTSANQTVTTDEDTPRAITLFGSDVEGDALTFQIVSGPSNGVLSGTGANRTYTPAPDFNGVDSFTYKVVDAGGAESAVATVTVNVTAVNDAPVNNVPGAQLTARGVPVVFSAANSNAVSVSDVDAGGGSVRVTLTASNGTLTLGGTVGLTFAVGDGSDDITMTLTGTVANVNAALNGLTFRPNAGFDGAASFQITTDDQGLTGAGGAKSDTDTVSITVERSLVEFAQATYTVAEGAGSLNVTVRRTGDTSQAASVEYATDDGSVSSVFMPCSSVTGNALDHCDFTRAHGTLDFAAGEAERTFTVLITDDSYVEGTETARLRLSAPGGVAALGPRTSATLEITDDAPETSGNPNDDSAKFVRQHYHDFLNREPDAPGLAHWTNVIESCGADAQCREVTRINVSGAFFLSIEFQETGFLVEKMYKASYGDATGTSTLGGTPHTLTVPVVRFEEFLPDTQRIGRGVIVNQGDWQAQIEANKVAFTQEFVQRARFLEAFPLSMTPTQFVDQLNARAGNPLDAAERQALINELTANNTTAGRASVLRKVAEDPTLDAAEKSRAFVLMQYFGYLRRNPDDAPDADYTGYDFWLGNLNRFNGNFVQAELVKAFISSTEYRQRFGQ